MPTLEQLPPFFYEIFDASLPREGPGDDDSTVRALNLLRPAIAELRNDSPTTELHVLDIGCGTGAPTLFLAKELDAAIVALDNHQPFLDELMRRARAKGVVHKIRTRLKDMKTLGPGDGPCDLIWSEGALFVMGFHHGLSVCHSLLRPGGGLAVTELCWIKPDPPGECGQFFARVYPAIADVETHVSVIRGLGFEILGRFVLPESAWWDAYYGPLEARLRWLRSKYQEDPAKREMIESIQAEIDLYRRHSDYYGYVFFVMRRR